jgi:hypothetical protein
MTSRDEQPNASQQDPQLRAEPVERLRDDVRLLGELVGQVLREQGGDDLYEAVEYLRTTPRLVALHALLTRHTSHVTA